MKSCVIAILLMFMSVNHAEGQDSLIVMFWNLENFFDFADSGKGESDREFSTFGKRRWTKKRFYRKCDAVAKAVLFIGDEYGRMPDIIGLAEIENRGVLVKLLNSTLLRKADYGIIHYESSDSRGIDVAALYRKSSMRQLSFSVKTPEYIGSRLRTRAILHSEMMLENGLGLNFIVNHHPSKFGGEQESAGKREAAVKALKELCDSLGNKGIVAMGDFNANPSSASFDILQNALINKALDIYEKGEGSIRYEGKWDLIDMFLLSGDLAEKAVMEVVRIPFLMTWDSKHPGEKPFRTYSGPRYIGGVSDHLPIILKMNFNQ